MLLQVERTPEVFVDGAVSVVCEFHGEVRGAFVLWIAVVVEEFLTVSSMDLVRVVAGTVLFLPERGGSGSGTPRFHLFSSIIM